MKVFSVTRLLLSLSLIFMIFINQPAAALSIPQSSTSDYSEKEGLELSGEWLFFANHFYSVEEVLNQSEEGKKITIPSKYKDSMKQTEGYGTFAIKVNLPTELVGTIQAIRVPYQHAAMDIYVDNTKVANAGVIAKNENDYLKMNSGPFSYFEVKSESFYVIVHFSSFGVMKSGFSAPISIGDPQELMKHKQQNFYVVVFLLGILILVGLFCIFIGFIDKKQRMLLLFGLFCLVVMLRCIITAPFLYTEILLPFEITPKVAIRIEYMLSLVIGYLFMSYLILLYKHLFNKYVLQLNKFVYLIAAITLIVIPYHSIQNVFSIFVAVQASLIGYLVKILFKAYKYKLQFALINIIIVLILASSLVFELLSAFNVIPAGPYVLIVLTLISVMLAYEFGKFYVNQIRKLHDLTQQLFIMNNSLDELVQKRTDELTVLNIKLQNQAIMDGMTGIYNRSYLNEKLDEFFNKAKQNHELLALVIFDIDEFKQYNDTNGHLKGDEIINEIVNIVKKMLPPNTIFARYGGEEFVMMFYNHEAHEVKLYCERIRKQVEAANIKHETSNFQKVTISVGGAIMKPEDNVTDPIKLLEMADNQLYVAKRTGKNKISFS